MSRRRVVVTGLGAVSPVGLNVADSWRAVKEGKSGVVCIDVVPEDFTVRIGAPVKGFDLGAYLDAKEVRRLDEFTQYGLAAGIQAVEDSGLTSAGYDPDRVGVIMGSGIGGIQTIESSCQVYREKGPKRISPFFIPACIINMLSGHLSIRYNFRGVNLATATACTTSTHAVGLAARIICWGDADAVVAGGAEASVSPICIAAFASMKALSSRNDTPEEASRPFDKERDGFVLGGGGGALVLEDYERAKKRGAPIYAEVIGFGMSGDAHHITSPIQDGTGFYTSMLAAVKDAGIDAKTVDYINAHGTSTTLGDIAETLAIKKLLGDDTRMPVSSTKSMIGHLLGAAGAVESIVTIMAMKDGVMPPTINLHEPDDQCDLDYIPNESRDADIRIAMSNSFGFGGTNGTLLFGRV